jgi:uncharacterized protein (TIGR00304 family)
MLQVPSIVTLAGIVLLLLGIVIIIAAFLSMTSRDSQDKQVRRESKGVVLLGPIPIVWGYGARGWIIAAIIAISLFILVLVFL